MKRILVALLCILLTVGLFGCVDAEPSNPKELKMDTPYYYTGVTFYRGENLTIEDLAQYNPSMEGAYHGEPIETIEDFEKFIRENLDTYHIYKRVDEHYEYIYFNVLFQNVSINKDYLKVRIEADDQHQDYQITYEKDGNKFISTDMAAPLTLYFADGRLYYEVEITEDFKVIYNYELSK